MANLQTMPTVLSLFKSELTSTEKTVAGAEKAGMIRTMADFAKGAYNLEHPGATEYVDINDVSPHATDAYDEVIGKGWTPLNFSSAPPTLDRGAIQYGMLDDGFYVNDNAAACVARCGDAIVLSFRGTNDNGKDGVVNPYDPNNLVHQDEDQWTKMPDHYKLLSPLINAFDSYVAANGIKKVYVTGHSMGGSMALEYMSHHSGSQYQAVTFAATPFGQPNWLSWFGGTERKDYSSDSRITQIEIEKDTAAMLFDQPNLLGNTNTRPGRVIDFGGDNTLTDKDHIQKSILGIGVLNYWGVTSNHSMDYYRQITDSVDADSWTRILAGTDTKTVLLGGEQVTGTSDFIVDGQLSGTNTSQTSGSDNLSSFNFKVIYGGKGNDTLWAGSNNTLLLGGVGNDYLYGQVGNDSLVGGTGNDCLNGGGGSDTMEGGAGNDIYYVNTFSDLVIESSASITEIDKVYSSISYALTDHVENLGLTGTNAINGTGNSLNNFLEGNWANNILRGYGGSDTLYGGAGNDTLNGDSGADSMSGGDGNDIYYVDNSLDTVRETNATATGGIDLVYSYLSAYTLGANIENGRISTSAAANLTGNALNNILYGGAGNNILNGGAGNDVLIGGLGVDKLTGGTGADRFDFNALSELGLSSTTRDTITDFKASEGDKIDLRGVDANTALAGVQAFSFLGTAAFTSNSTGKLRFDATAHILYGSTDADTAAEFAIALTGVSSLSAANFVL